MLHETNFSPNKGTRCGVLIHEVQILFDAQRNSRHFQQCWGDWGDELKKGWVWCLMWRFQSDFQR